MYLRVHKKLLEIYPHDYLTRLPWGGDLLGWAIMETICFFPHKFFISFFSYWTCITFVNIFPFQKSQVPWKIMGRLLEVENRNKSHRRRRNLAQGVKCGAPMPTHLGLWTFSKKELVPSECHVPLTELLMPRSCKKEEIKSQHKGQDTLFFTKKGWSLAFWEPFFLEASGWQVSSPLPLSTEHGCKNAAQMSVWALC